ncbi:MAG: TIM barrel protein [Actinomycetota bacterium]
MTSPPLSANLGFLWTELELLDAVRAAHGAGFDAVEVHWPYITHAVEVALVLEELGLPLISLNTVGGDLSVGEFGLAAVPGREDDARAAIDKAFAYAVDVSARFVHVLAGKTDDRRAAETFASNLLYASARGHEFGVGVLIEPISPESQPGYFLNSISQAAEILARVDEPNVRLLFDCYHAQLIHGQVENLIDEHIELIGHVQIAAVPDRTEPDHGDVDYGLIMDELDELGYEGHVGAEYRPAGKTDEGLGWLADLRA